VEQAKTKGIHGLVVGGVVSRDPVAEKVELGTGLWGPKHAKYPIVPVNGRVLKFLWWHSSTITRKNGTRLKTPKKNMKFATTEMVMHPGSPGQHMFLKGIMDTEVVAVRIMDKRMKIWQRELRVLRTSAQTKVLADLLKARRRGRGLSR
jgi:hypothetical protein